jgi:hypothetical protein
MFFSHQTSGATSQPFAPITLIVANLKRVLKTKDYIIRLIKMNNIKVEVLKCVSK